MDPRYVMRLHMVYTPQCSTQTLLMCSLLAAYHMVSLYTCTCNFIYDHKETMTFPAPVCSELTNAQHHVQILYAGSHPNWTLNVEITY